MKATRTTSKKLKASTVLFCIAVISMVIGIVFFVLDIVGIVDEIDGFGVTSRILLSALFVVGFILLAISMLVNISYRKSCAAPGKWSTFMYIMGWIFMLPVMVVVFVIMLWGGVRLSFSGSDEVMQVTVKDENGNVYHLTQTFVGSIEYKDQNGDLWKSLDWGKTFERVEKKVTVKDSEGNEKTLTPTYDSMLTQHYQDQDGEEWKSQDGGKTVEHVVTHATVKDKDGKEYNLRAMQAGLDNFIDQNGDMWTTYDGGQTYERRKICASRYEFNISKIARAGMRGQSYE